MFIYPSFICSLEPYFQSISSLYFQDNCTSCKRNLREGDEPIFVFKYPLLICRLEPYLSYISNLNFHDSCKNCKRNLGGGEGGYDLDSIYLSYFHFWKRIALLHIGYTVSKYPGKTVFIQLCKRKLRPRRSSCFVNCTYKM